MESDDQHDIEENPPLNENEKVEELKSGMSFSSREEVYAYYAKYAKHVGFSIAHCSRSFGDDGELKYFGIECSRAGKRRKISADPLKPSLSKKIGCKARIRATVHSDGKCVLSTVVLQHNHDLLPTDTRHFRSNKRILKPAKRKLKLNDRAGIRGCRNFHFSVVEAGGFEHLTFDEKDCCNSVEKARRLSFGVKDVESIRSYFLRMQAQNSIKLLCNELDIASNAQFSEFVHQKFNEIVKLASSSKEKQDIVLSGLDEIKGKVLKVEPVCGSNQSTFVSSPRGVDGSIMESKETSKLLSPSVLRRRGRPITNRKVSKVDQICQIKARKKKRTQEKGEMVEVLPSLHTPHDANEVGTKESLNVMAPSSHFSGGTSLAPTESRIIDVFGSQTWMGGSNQFSGGGNLNLLCNLSKGDQSLSSGGAMVRATLTENKNRKQS